MTDSYNIGRGMTVPIFYEFDGQGLVEKFRALEEKREPAFDDKQLILADRAAKKKLKNGDASMDFLMDTGLHIDAAAKKLRKYGKRIGKRIPIEKAQWAENKLITDLYFK